MNSAQSHASATQPLCNPQAVANFFLDKAGSRGLTPMQLNKLCYIAHGWVLATMNRPLFDEPVEAWQHGPVIPSLYHEFKHFGARPITNRSEMFVFDQDKFVQPRVNPTFSDLLGVLNKVWSIYGGLDGARLRALTHQKDSPWDKSYRPGERHIRINDDVIREHYISLIKGLIARERAAAT